MQAVVLGPADHQVVSGVAEQGVAPGPAVDEVVALLTAHQVVAVLAVQPVVLDPAHHMVVASVAEERIAPGPAVDEVVPVLTADAVVTVLAEQAVVLDPAHHQIVSGVAEQGVAAGPAVDEVVSVLPPDPIVAGFAVEPVAAGAAFQKVGACAPVEQIVPAEAAKLIVAPEPFQQVRPLIAEEAIGEPRAEQVLYVEKRVAAQARVLSVRPPQVHHRPTAADGVEEGVVHRIDPGAAVEEVRAFSPVQQIVARVAPEDVVALGAGKDVRAVAAVDLLDTATADHQVVPASAEDPGAPVADGQNLHVADHHRGAFERRSLIEIDGGTAGSLEKGEVDHIGPRAAVDADVGQGGAEARVHGEDVVASAPKGRVAGGDDDPVIPVAAVQSVGSVIAVQDVGAGAAVQDVVAGVPPKRVVAAQAVDLIVAGPSVDVVSRLRPRQKIGAACASDVRHVEFLRPGAPCRLCAYRPAVDHSRPRARRHLGYGASAISSPGRSALAPPPAGTPSWRGRLRGLHVPAGQR